MDITTKLTALAAVVLFSGCASHSSPSLDLLAQTAAAEQLQLASPDPALRAEAEQDIQLLLAEPLTADSSSQIAVLNNAGFQAAMASLAISKAELSQAGLLPNPGLRIRRIRDDQGYSTELDFSLDLFKLIFLKQNQQIAGQQAEQQQQQLVLQLMELINQSRSAWVEAVFAKQQFHYLQQVQEAIEASAELANRMYQVGNYSELQRARQLKFAAEIRLQLAKAQQQKQQSQQQLAVLLGLSPDTALLLPDHLPGLPAELQTAPLPEKNMLAQRLDLQQAKSRLQQLELQLQQQKSSRFIRGLSAEVAASVQHKEEREIVLGFELPLFDTGSSRISKAEAEYQQAWWQAKALEQKARAEQQLAYQQLQSSYQIARHYQDQLLPLAQKINQQNLLRYNGMLIGVFELIADSQAQVATVTGQMSALRDFYLAEQNLKQSLSGSPILLSNSGANSADTSTQSAGH
jgi:cobalt-zinc-cadmium efflux system outer membrane protein